MASQEDRGSRAEDEQHRVAQPDKFRQQTSESPSSFIPEQIIAIAPNGAHWTFVKDGRPMCRQR
jgi:hypothetical protein